MTKSAGRQTFDEDLVLDAAARVFRKRGYSGATVREVAQAAEMLPGSLYYRYPSKEALLLDLMERALTRLLELGRSAVEFGRDPAERLRLGLRAHLEALLSGDDDFYVLLYDWRSMDGSAMQAILRLRSEYEAFWDGLCWEAVRSGWVRPNLDVELLRQFGIGALNWVVQWRHETDPRTPAEIADTFWSYLAFGLLAEDKRPKPPVGPMARKRKAARK